MVYGTKVLCGYTNDTSADEMSAFSQTCVRDLQDPVITASFDYRDSPDRHPLKQMLSHDPAIESRVAYLLKADAAARAASNLISQTRGMCREVEQRIEIFKSEGLHIADTRHYARATMTSIAADGSEQATGMRSDGGMIGWELSEKLDAEQTGAEASRQAMVNLGAKACPSGRMPVVIGNGFGGVIFHEACGHLLETTSVAKRASVFHDKLGEMIANPAVSASDDGTLVNDWGSLNIDDEGMETQHTQLIKDGSWSVSW